MTARLVLLRASVFMFFVKVLKSHSEDVQSCQRQRTVQERGTGQCSVSVNLIEKCITSNDVFIQMLKCGKKSYVLVKSKNLDDDLFPDIVHVLTTRRHNRNIKEKNLDINYIYSSSSINK